MSPFEAVNLALQGIGAEYNRPFELNEDGFLTLDWGAGPAATISAPLEGTAFSIAAPLFLLPVDKPLEPVFRELLRYNLPGALRPGESVAASRNTVLLTLERPADSVDAASLKNDILSLSRDAAELDYRLRDFILNIPDESPSAPSGATEERDRLDPGLSPEELLRASMIRRRI